MKKPTLLYALLTVILLFVATVFITHYAVIFQRHAQAAATVQVPFSLDGEITSVKSEAEAAGLKVGDRIASINGAEINSNQTYFDAVAKLKGGEMLQLVVIRKEEAGAEPVRYNISVLLKEIPQDTNYYARIVVGFATEYLLPTFCVLLGFWVAFLRPRDFLAWLFLFMLLGLSSLSFEGFPNTSLLGVYNRIFFNMWALSMMLFGIYFPEPLPLDKKAPWLKWILIAPLAFQILLSWMGLIETYTGVSLFYYIAPIARSYGRILIVVNMVAISIFFASIGYKAWTVGSPDARRRLRLMLFGTTVALLPSFSIVIYRVASGIRGGAFSDLVPFWYALFALAAMLLFPLTLAYVIVVHRAMDISVVIRQGLQYALAQRGVQILQFILLLVVILSAFWMVRNFGQDMSAQIAAVAIGLILIPLIQFIAKRLRGWIDRRFFREAYNSEQILTELSEEVRTMVETKPLLEKVSNKISQSMHVPQIALLLRNGDRFIPAHALGYDVPPAAAFAENSLSIEKLQKNEPVIVYQDDKRSWVNEEAGPDERSGLRELNSQLLLPLGSKEALSGVISLSPKRSEEPYSPNDLRLLKLVAAQTGLALENSRLTEAIISEASQKERLNRELEIAREVQERLFPQELPPVSGLDYFGACRPALGVGGDYYDFIELPEGRFGIAIGDVSGKGIGASLMMASLQASLRGQALHYKNDLATLMKQVNTLVYEASTSNRYATFFYAQYLPETRMLSYVNAGHNPPFLLRPVVDTPPEGGTQNSFEVIRLEDGGPVVGMLPTMFTNYSQGEIMLQPGDLLVGYTDGISEAMNPAEEEWGEEAMLEQLKICFASAAADILPFIVERADEFAAGAKQHDDMTMIVIKVV